jgi:hypothetical protein
MTMNAAVVPAIRLVNMLEWDFNQSAVNEAAICSAIRQTSSRGSDGSEKTL